MKKGANDYIEKLKNNIKIGDRVISLHEDVRGGTVRRYMNISLLSGHLRDT